MLKFYFVLKEQADHIGISNPFTSTIEFMVLRRIWCSSDKFSIKYFR